MRNPHERRENFSGSFFGARMSELSPELKFFEPHFIYIVSEIENVFLPIKINTPFDLNKNENGNGYYERLMKYSRFS